jgi:Mg-chelatase subunit ChlD
MASVVQQYLNFNHTIARNYGPSNQSIDKAKAFLQNNFNCVYNTALSYVPSTQQTDKAKAFLWNNKEVIIAGAVIGLAIWKIVHYIRNRPQLPDVEFDTSLNFAELTIKIPKEKSTPPNVTLTFCVDMSSSMKPDERAGEVKRALKTLLDNAQQVVTRSAEAKISIAITGFTDTSTLITQPTALASTSKKSEEIKKQVEALQFNGSTDILDGLAGTVQELKKMAKANRQASHYVVLLTDGEDNSCSEKKLQALQKEIASTSAKLFAIGIGQRHSKEILKAIATDNGFDGTYIDTTTGKDTIANTIAAIYNQAISSFQELELSCSLAADTWSVNGKSSRTEKEQSKFLLGTLEEGKTLTSHIVIHGNKLKEFLDLSTVFFNLSFKDPKGRNGQIKLHWNPTPIVDPAIASACHNYR